VIGWRDRRANGQPGAQAHSSPGDWSFGDLAGHVVGWRNRTISRLEAFSRGEPDPPDPWPTPRDARLGLCNELRAAADARWFTDFLGGEGVFAIDF
jgi:hypothetical protein